MDLQRGQSVLVNVAAFTAARFRSREAIPCDVLDVQPGRVLVRTQFPYRVFSMWVSADWIDSGHLSGSSVV